MTDASKGTRRPCCNAGAAYSVVTLLLTAAFGCVVDVDPRMPSDKEGVPIGAVHGELRRGDRGPDVDAVFRHLLTYGYFPSQALEDEYPYWQPVTSKLPDDSSVFGPELESAVRAYQGYIGVEPTGTVDAKTLRSMQTPRCGNPENEWAGFDPSEKWDVNDGQPFFASTTVNWSVVGCHDADATNINLPCPASIISAGGGSNGTTTTEAKALGMWQAETNLNFVNVTCGASCTAPIQIRYYPHESLQALPDGWPKFGASAGSVITGPDSNGVYRIGVKTTNATSSPFSLQTLLSHELGHALGLAHSAIGPNAPPGGSPLAPVVESFVNRSGMTVPAGTPFQSLMFFSGGWPLKLTVDDRVAVLSRYGAWRQITGLNVFDIAVGGSLPTTPIVWATSSLKKVFKLVNGTWRQDVANTLSANSIAVARDGTPWAVSTGNNVFRRSGPNHTTGDWGNSLGGAIDVAAGGDTDAVWIVSTTQAASGGFTVKRWNGSSFVLPSVQTGALRIALDHRGRPMVTKADGSIWTNLSPTAALPWTRMDGATPGPAVGCAHDIGGGSNGGIFVTGCVSFGSDFDVWTLARNIADPPNQGGDGRILNRNVWRPMGGIAAFAAAGPDGRAYVAQAAGAVFVRAAR